MVEIICRVITGKYLQQTTIMYFVFIQQQRDSRAQLGMVKLGNDGSSTSNISNNLIRSHSHSNVNKPSQGLLGLTLHEISDPIETSVTAPVSNAPEEEKQPNERNNLFEVSKERETENQSGPQDSGTLCNTSKGKHL